MNAAEGYKKQMNKFSAGIVLMIFLLFSFVLMSSAMPRFCFFLMPKRKSPSAAVSRSKTARRIQALIYALFVVVFIGGHAFATLRFCFFSIKRPAKQA
ncbi:hypothetical protein ACFSR6_18045 [Pedobacter vanadiisoli]|uniref:Uncharacterized protein n=1 Tax=Pedobacter vanadiisoli TaxID=1761975 RepID=A0ABW5MMS7_9SPHI